MYVDDKGNHKPHYDDSELMSIVDVYHSSKEAIFERRATQQQLFDYKKSKEKEGDVKEESDEAFAKRMDKLMMMASKYMDKDQAFL